MRKDKSYQGTAQWYTGVWIIDTYVNVSYNLSLLYILQRGFSYLYIFDAFTIKSTAQ